MAEEQQEQQPKCFDSLIQWDQYAALWRLSQGHTRVRYCTDCTAQYRDEMMAQGRCDHPETVFIKQPDGEEVGIDGSFWSTWVSALSGKRGIVLSQPRKDVRDQFMRDKFGADAKAEDIPLNKNAKRLLRSKQVKERREERMRRAKAMRAYGATFEEIANELGVSETTASRFAQL